MVFFPHSENNFIPDVVILDVLVFALSLVVSVCFGIDEMKMVSHVSLSSQLLSLLSGSISSLDSSLFLLISMSMGYS